MNSPTAPLSNPTPLIPAQGKTVTEVSWGLKPFFESIDWGAPEVFTRNLPKPTTSKSVQVCPAAVDFDARYFVIKCPADLTIRLILDENAAPTLQTNTVPGSSTKRSSLDSSATLIDPNDWRHKDRPIIQIPTPYVFLSEELVYLNLSPAFMDYRSSPLPGMTMNARFTIKTQPNQLVWSFEWHDIQKEIKFKQGEPWFYVYFESSDPSRKVRLLEPEQSDHLLY